MGLALLLPFFLFLSAPSEAAKPKHGQVIDRIVIDVYDVFETDDPADDTTFYSVANSIHIKTREAVVHRELLFKIGDKYDENLIEETERNLRRLPFVRRAEVEGHVDSSGTLKVMVRVYDSWTLEPIVYYKRLGEQNQLRLGLAENNVLGYGKQLKADYGKYGREELLSFGYSDPQLWGTRHRLDFLVEDGPQRTSYGAKLERPFFASITRFSYGVGSRYYEEPKDFYEDEMLTATGRKKTSEFTSFVGYAFENTPKRSKRATFGVEKIRNDYSHRPRQELTYLRGSAELKQFRFIKRKRVRKLSRIEDFNMGWELEPGAAWAPKVGGTEEQLQPRVSLTKGWPLPVNGFSLLRFIYQSTYVNGGNGDRTAESDFETFLQPHPRHTLAMRAGYAHGWRLDPARRLTLGEDNGLRGYGLSQFQGSQRVILNLEDRMFFVENVLKLIDLGGVVFFDAGHAWPKGTGMRFEDLKTSVGIGLRLAATRSAANDPIRIDIGRALVDTGRSQWSVSILAGHSF